MCIFSKVKFLFFFLSLLPPALATELDLSLPKIPKVELCGDRNCLDQLVLNDLKGSGFEEGCTSCDSGEETLKQAKPFSWEREAAEIAKVAVLTELLTKTQSEQDKKMHVRAGAYIGYFSKKACQYGPELFNWDFEIGPTGQFFCAVAGATVAGIFKEAYDKTDPENHTVDHRDALATSLGAVVNIPLFSIEF